MFFKYLTKRNLFSGMLLMVAYYFASRLPDSKTNFITLTIVVSLFLLLFGIYGIFSKFFIEDINSKKQAKETLIKYTVLFLLWISSVFLAKQAGAWGWLFSAFDDGTLLFFIYIPFVFLFGISAKTIIVLAIIIWVYTAFFYLNKFTMTSELFAILTFWLFTMATIKGIIET